MASIAVAVGKGEHALAGAIAIDVTTFIAVAVLEGVDAASVLAVVLPVALVFVAVGIEVDPLA